MSPETFDFRVAEGVGHVTLNRPARLNALTFESYAELRDLLVHLRAREDVRALVLTGEGRAFCAGGDKEDIIGRLFERDLPGLLDFTRLTGDLIGALRALRKPIVAAVNGVAVGAGAVMALACDVRLAAPTARFGFVFPQVGLCGADMGAAWLLPRVVGLGHASELLFTGDVIDAPHALRIGLVNRVVPADDLLAEASALAARLARGPAFAHAMTKQMLEDVSRLNLREALEAEAQAQALCMAHPDFREAYEARRAGRPPAFRGAPDGEP